VSGIGGGKGDTGGQTDRSFAKVDGTDGRQARASNVGDILSAAA